MLSLKPLLAIATLAIPLALAGSAAAQTCTTDADCPRGHACVESGVVNGTTPACPPDAPCPKTDPPPPPQKYFSCQPKSCTSDADCGAGLVCHSETSMACSGGAAVAPCPPNTACPEPVKTEPTCTTTTRSFCAFKWQLPCNADADCGDAFKCQPHEIGVCSGGAGTGSSSSGSSGGSSGSTSPRDGGTASTGSGSATSPTAPADGDNGQTMCTTMTSYPGSCRPKATTCTADSDCPADWKCIDGPSNDLPPMTEPGTGGSRGSDTPTTSTPATSPTSSTKFCWSPVGSYGGGIPGADRGSKGGEGTSNPTGPTLGTDQGGAPPPAPMTPGSGTDSSKGSKAGGCSINPATDSSRASGLALFALVALIAAGRLRKRSS